MKLLSLFLHYVQKDYNEIMLHNNIASSKYLTKKQHKKLRMSYPRTCKFFLLGFGIWAEHHFDQVLLSFYFGNEL
jgi:hypothetical protein